MDIKETLSYVLITPYTIMKSRTGGVIARLLSRTDIELIGAQILAPTKRFAEEYSKLVYDSVVERDPATAKLLSDYIRINFAPEGKKYQRVMALLFKGDEAYKKLYSVVGHIQACPITKDRLTGETIRDTYADLVFDHDGTLKYFEPAVLTPTNIHYLPDKLKLLSEFASRQSNIVKNIINAEEGSERTLVIIKPDNWRQPSVRPGNIIDMFSRTGLRIVGCKIYQMSVKDALRFYGPVKNVLKHKLSPVIGERAKKILEEQFDIILPQDSLDKLISAVGIPYAENEFNKIVKFMTGNEPNKCPETEYDKPGNVKTMVLIYEGRNAIKKIREVLGPTDPTKAPSGTIRREFGTNVMINTAHASDSVENAKREMKIVKINKNPMSEIITKYLAVCRS